MSRGFCLDRLQEREDETKEKRKGVPTAKDREEEGMAEQTFNSVLRC